MTHRVLQLTGSQVRLLKAVEDKRIYLEIGKPWDARGIETCLTGRVDRLLRAGLVVLGEERDKARRPLYELTAAGRGWLERVLAKTGGGGHG